MPAPYKNWAVDAQGNVVAEAQVEVRDADGELAVIFGDNSGAPLANPFTANVDGSFEFWAGNGEYTVTTGAPPTSASLTATIFDIYTPFQPFRTFAELVSAVEGGLDVLDGTIVHIDDVAYKAQSGADQLEDRGLSGWVIAGGALSESLTLNIPSDFSTLQRAFDAYSPVAPGVHKITLNIESGHALTAGVSLDDGNYDHFVITAEDDTVELAGGFSGVDGTAFAEGTNDDLFVFNNCAAPRLTTVIDMQGEHGVGVICGNGGYMNVSGGAGVINAGAEGLVVRQGRFYGRGTVWSGAQSIGCKITSSSHADLGGAIINDCCQGTPAALNGALHVSRASVCLAQNVEIDNSATVGITCRRSWCAAEECTVTNSGSRGVDSRNGGWLIVNRGTITGSGGSDLVNITDGGIIYANGATYGSAANPINSFNPNGGIVFDDQKPLGAPLFYHAELDNDEVFSFELYNMPGPLSGGSRAATLTITTSTFGANGQVYARVPNNNCSLIVGQGKLETTTGVLSGTTGNDGNLTVSTDDQRVYIENRIGNFIRVGVAISGWAAPN